MPSIPYRAARWAYFRTQTHIRPRLLQDCFELDGERYPLFLHENGMTWRSERIVEIPIAQRAVASLGGGRLLEVGNVMGQYGLRGHDVVDRYELGSDVIHEDAETFSGGPYDLILSISTVEHMGWDETPRDPGKIPRVIANFRRMLAPGGRILITFPHRWNRDLDDLVASGDHPFDRVRYLRRLDYANRRWSQQSREEIAKFWFGYPYVGACAVGIATIDG